MSTLEFSPAMIRKLRELLGMTQEQLAACCGVQRTTVTLWESGLRNPSGSAAVLLEQLKEKAEKQAKNSVQKKF